MKFWDANIPRGTDTGTGGFGLVKLMLKFELELQALYLSVTSPEKFSTTIRCRL